MGIDYQTRMAIDFVQPISATNPEVLFIGSPSLVIEGNDSIGYLERRFPNGWESVDISKNQRVNYIADFCRADLGRQYDLIIDHGSLQHFYDPFAGIMNVIRHLKPSGVALHVLPFTGYGGFGYWQITPSVFFELEEQGFIKIEKVVYFSQNNRKYFFEQLRKQCCEFHFARRTRFFIAYKRVSAQLPSDEPFFQRHEFDPPQQPLYRQRSNRIVFLFNQLVSVLWEELFLRPAPWRGDNKHLKIYRSKESL